jgi:hypothetical protein
MFHEANLRAYDGIHTLLGDLLDRTLDRYGQIFTLPVRSPTLAALGEWTKNRMKYNAAGIRCSFTPAQGTLTITATRATVVPVTGLCTASAENYGGQCISHIALQAGQSVTLNTGAANSSSAATGVTSTTAASPKLGAITASPNPFNPETAIDFTTARAGHVTARIYDVSGRAVRTLVDKVLEAGSHTFRWNGSTDDGERAASGIYFLKLRSPDGDGEKRLILAK